MARGGYNGQQEYAAEAVMQEDGYAGPDQRTPKPEQPWYIRRADILIVIFAQAVAMSVAYGDYTRWRSDADKRIDRNSSDIDFLKTRDSDLRVQISGDLATIKGTLQSVVDQLMTIRQDGRDGRERDRQH